MNLSKKMESVGKKLSLDSARSRFSRRRRVFPLAGRCALLLACLLWSGVDQTMAWRKSPRCNMTTEFECKTGHCIPVDQVCNRHADCVDGSDESDCHCVQTWLPPMHRCRNKKCVDDFYTCNGKDDCGDGGSDEENCACYGFRCADGTCILSTWRCDGYKDCKDYSDESNCGALLSGDRRHPFFGLIGPVGCLVAALSIRVLLRSHHRRRLLHSNGETAAAAAAVAALEARNRRARFAEDGDGGGGGVAPAAGGASGVDRLDDSLEAGVNGGGGGHCDRLSSAHWMDRVGAGISSSIAQMRILFNGQPAASLPPPPPYTETTTLTDLPPAYQQGGATAAPGAPSVYLLVIPAGKPPPSYNESMSLPDLVQSTGNANQRGDDTPSDTNHFVPVSSDDPSASVHAPTANFATTTSGYASNNESLLRSAALPSTTAPAAFYSAIPPVEFHADPSASGDIPFTASSTEEAPFAFASTSAASSPLRVVFRPEFGVTLRQNPLSDEMVQPGHAGVTAACQQQDQDEELPPPYDDLFIGDAANGPSDSMVIDEEPGPATIEEGNDSSPVQPNPHEL